eukprot:scaffold19.g1830.t1
MFGHVAESPRTAEHKVRGGSALTAALHSLLGSTTLADGGSMSFSGSGSASTSRASYGHPSTGAPAPGAVSPTGQLGRTMSGASAASSGGSTSKRTRLGFLSCFSPGRVDRAALPDEPSVTRAEVGIRPCLYWLDAEISAEERMFAEANARWLKTDCQDEVVVIERFGGAPHQMFAGVFDGHGPYGRSAAKHASAALPSALAAAGPLAALSDRRWARLLRDACRAVNASMKDAATAGFDASLSGSTACFGVILGSKVHIASVGDSRCLVARRTPSGGVEAVQVRGRGRRGRAGARDRGGPASSPTCGAQLTEDAKPQHPEEMRRIHSAGGVVKQLKDESGELCGAYRVFRRGDDVLPGLAMSRSLGDVYAQAVGVTCEPHVTTYTLSERDLFLVFATDGVCDVMSNEQVVDFIERYKQHRDASTTCAEALTLEAQQRWKAAHEEAIVDDISVAIVHTSTLPPPRRTLSIPSALAHAASCNDEANDWLQDAERNPSNHRVDSEELFGYLYRSSAAAAAAAAAAAEARDAGPARAAAGAPGAGVAPPTPSAAPAEPAAEAAAQPAVAPAAPAVAVQRAGSGQLAAPVDIPRCAGSGQPPVLAAQLPTPVVFARGTTAASPFISPSGSPCSAGEELRRAAQGGTSLAAEADLDSLDGSLTRSPRSPRSPNSLQSSLALSDATSQNPSVRLGDAYGGAAASEPVGPPAPVHRLGGGARPSSAPVGTLLPPIRKAYPASGGLHSYKSDASSSLLSGELAASLESSSYLAAQRGPSDGPPRRPEGKVRGGVPRTSSAPGLSLLLGSSMSLRCSEDSLSHGGSRDSSLGDRSCSLAAAATGTPCTPPDSLLLSSITPPDRNPAAPGGHALTGALAGALAGPRLHRSRSEGAAVLVASSCGPLDSPARAGLLPLPEERALAAEGGVGAAGAVPASPPRPRVPPPRSPQQAAASKLFVLKGVHGSSCDSLASGSHSDSLRGSEARGSAAATALAEPAAAGRSAG